MVYKDISMTFLEIVSCRYSDPIPKYISNTKVGYHYDFQLQEYHNLLSTFKVPSYGPSLNVQGHLVVIHRSVRS